MSEDANAEHRVDHSRPTQVIDGIKFRHTLDRGAAMSHGSESDEYWGWDKGKCFELVTAVTYTNFGSDWSEPVWGVNENGHGKRDLLFRSR